MKKLTFSIFITVISLLFISSCGKKSGGMAFATAEASDSWNESGFINSSKSVSFDQASPEIEEAEAVMMDSPSPEVPKEQVSSSYERKLILNGDISIEVEKLEDVRSATDNLVKKLGGYISDSSEWSNGLSITIRIPSSSFYDAMNSVSGIGKIRSKNINTSDVTDQYYDIDTRLTTKKVMLERLETYLKQAKDVKDMIEIETKINEVTSDIEVMQGQLNRLSSLISYSTITISARLPVNQTQQGFVMPDAKSKFREFARDVLNFFVQFFFVILYIIIYGIPILAAVLLLYWLLIGKVGILRKIFCKIKANKNSQDQ
ncbi:MAG: DUF4349 domain-containing protein [Treponema sp.]|nr:DUF4349 domain-containing protein [Treponema sp.]